jgi:hypothetical protein
MTGGGTATGGGGSMRGRGRGTGRWDAMQQPAEQERFYERQSWQMGGYATTSQIRGAQQEANAQKMPQLDKRWGCLLMGGSTVTEGSDSMRGGDAGGWEATRQPTK